MKKIILIVSLILLMAAGVVLLKKRKQAVVDLTLPIPVTYSVRTVHPETRTVAQTSTFLAKLAPVNRAEISSKLSGRISEVAVRESRAVRQGELLVRIDDQETAAAIKGLQAQLDPARAQEKYSKTQYDRNQALYKAGGLAREKLESSEVVYRTAGAAVKEIMEKIKGLENQLEYLNIKAPFAGIVGTIFLHQGDLAAPGKPILSLNSMPQKLTFSFTPGSRDIRPGQQVMLQEDETRGGKIVNLYDDAHNGLSVAEVVLEDRVDQPAGSYLGITVIEKTASGCAVPLRSLLHRTDGTSIMVYQKDHFTEQTVTVQARDREYALIDPCAEGPVAEAAEAKLSLLTAYGSSRILASESNE